MTLVYIVNPYATIYRFIDASETIDREDRNGQQRIQSTLVVKGIKESAIQSYGCGAENRAGRAEKFTDIFIKGLVSQEFIYI